jgi:hypothetical protein
MGTAQLLFPPGITDLRELPAGYFDAIGMALGFLSFEELPEEDRPPRRIWLNNEALKEHFAAVKARRKAEADPNAPDPIEDPVDNPAARDLIAR